MLAVVLTPVAGQTVPFGADLLRMDRGGILFGSAAVQECLEGDLVWIWGDRRAPVDRSTDYSLFLMTDGRVLVPLRIDDDVLRRAGGFLGLREKHVQVQGSWCQTEMLAKSSHSEFEATAIALASEGSTSAIINKTAEHAIGLFRIPCG